jgi:hypothetical protein
MSNIPYKLSLPTTIEPAVGFKSNDRIVFKLPITPGQQCRKGSVRLNGMLQLLKLNGNGESIPIVQADKVYLNPNAGVSGCIRQITSSVNGQIVETINEYGRYVASSNEAKYFQLDGCTKGDSMLELMTYSNDNYQTGASPDAKMKAYTGLLFPANASQSELPFSVDLDIVLNSSDMPASKVQEMELSIILQDANKCGLVSRSGTPTAFLFAMKTLQVRYICDAETFKGPVVVEVKNNSFIGTALNRISNLEHSPAVPFTSIFATFLKQGNDNTATSFTYDYLASEAITEGVDYFEVKVNGQSDYLQFPLRFRQTEMTYNYLLAHHVGEEGALKHGLSYGKLAQSPIKTGYGLGCPFSEQLPQGTRIAFNVALNSAPSLAYRAFFYTKGFVQL